MIWGNYFIVFVFKVVLFLFFLSGRNNIYYVLNLVDIE